MENKILEIFIPGPAGRLEAKYFKSRKPTSPIALVLHPHPQYGGTMNNKVVFDTFNVMSCLVTWNVLFIIVKTNFCYYCYFIGT